MQHAVRIFTAGPGADSWTELTGSGGPAVRLRSADLQRAQRERRRIRAREEVAVVLDVRVLIADDFRAASRALGALGSPGTDTVQYAGTLPGLVGLVRDVFAAEVADGVTLVPATSDQDVRALALATLGVLEADAHRAAG